MKTTEHLSENQLNNYFGDALEDEKKHAIGRHLLQCDFCLKRLPQPTIEQFWAALMTENNLDDPRDEKTASAERSGFIAKLLKQPKIFALSAAALVIVLFFSAFLWLNAVKSSEMEKEVAENFDIPHTQPVFARNEDEKIEKPSTFPSVESVNANSPASTKILPKRELPAANAVKLKQNPKTDSQNDFNAKTLERLPDDEKVNISQTRGGAAPKCGNQQVIDLTVKKSDEKIVLKWKKVPNAAKYHIYVSDEDEILIDEYETEQGTAYALTKPLDPLKTYQWKVVITLENGNTLIGDSRKFTVKDIQQNLKKSERNNKSVVRCTANN